MSREEKIYLYLGIAVGAGLIALIGFFTLILYLVYGGNAVLKLG